MSRLARWDTKLMALIGWAYRRLSPTARAFLLEELLRRAPGREGAQ